MKRKDFFKNILLGTTGMLLSGGKMIEEKTDKQKIRLATFFITGFQYYDGRDVEHLLETEMPILLNRQPHNKYDKNAIEVYSGEAKLGFIPRSDNKVIAEIMDQGIEVKGKITELNPDAIPFGNVKAEIWYEKEIIK